MDLRDRVARICQSWFGQAPISVEQVHRPGAGFQELEATLPNRNVVVRLGLPVDRVRGAWALRPVFEKCGIPVAETLAASEGDEIESEPYQVFERLDGTDLLYAMDRLEDDELAQVAADVLRLMSLLSVAPSPGGFGAISNWEPGGFSSWSDRVLDEARLANLKCLVGGLLPSDTLVKLYRLLRERRGWFDAVKSTPYYAEMLARDVIICRGRVRGLVPPGVIVLGDPLELLGRCQAAWLGHSRGMAYVGALLEASNLNAEARGMADLYCALARVQWLAERRPGHPPRWGADGPAVETSPELDRHLTAELIASL